MGSLFNGLTKDGILVSQVGETVKLIDPAQTYSINRNRALFVNSMMDQGFVSIVEYDEVSRNWGNPIRRYEALPLSSSLTNALLHVIVRRFRQMHNSRHHGRSM